MTIDEIREQIQQDISCLLDGFGVSNLVNKQGVTLDELAGQIVVDNFNRLDKPQESIQVDHTWFMTSDLSTARTYNAKDWISLTNKQKEMIKIEYPNEDYHHYLWYNKFKRRWSWYTSLGADWYVLDVQSREEIRKQFPDMDWVSVRWAYVIA